MPFGNIGAYACQNLQTDLVDYFARNAPQYRTYGNTSTLKWLLSPQNTNGFKKLDVSSGIPGKKRPVAMQIADPYCFDIAKAARLCTNTAGNISQTPQEIVYDFTGDPFRIVDDSDAPLRLKIDLAALQAYCTINDFSWLTDQINRLLFRFEEQLDLRIFELLAAGVGTNKAGDAVTNLPLWVLGNNNTAILNPETQFALNQTMNDIGVNTQWGAIGGSIINKINQFTKWLGLDSAGVDMSKVLAINPFTFYDRNAEDVIGITDFLQLAPGAAQLITWNRYGPGSSVRREVTDLYSNGTITLPTTGLDIDWKWRYDYECEIWYFEPSLFADVVIVPAGGCNTPGVNGIIQVHDCSGQPVIPVCPEVPVG